MLAERGADVRRIAVDTDADGREELTERLRAALAETDGIPFTGVLSLLALDGHPHPRHPSVPAGVAAQLALVQALGDAEIGAPLWSATRGAVSVGRAEPLESPEQALVWGLGRVAALEHGERWGGLVDLPGAPDERALARLVTALAGPRRRTRSRSAPPGCSYAVWCAPRWLPRPLYGPGSRPAPLWSPAVRARWAPMWRAGWPATGPSIWCSPAAVAWTPRARRTCGPN
ncbi:Rossmann-fold NAD(P)-binding domain-containing protein [Streptomyces malaysiensis]|uniref:hypothetical protein n=1 Tax=Streptomyces sp. HNM0561 TaxID=2903099 RepID=UPI001E5A4C38|nr:hypothetical protein [Streptomyces sp. HNM0561]UHH17984.1 hypothetical protein LUV23_17660 [Streptomyces sp. HNM0561]